MIEVSNSAVAMRRDDPTNVDLTSNDGDYSPIAVGKSGVLGLGGVDSDDTNELLPIYGASRGDGTVDMSVKVNGTVGATANITTLPSLEPSTKNYTTTGTSTSTNNVYKALYYSIQVKGVGAAPTSWTVALEGSNDDTNWTTILTHATADGDGTTKVLNTAFPCRYVRSNCSALSLGGASSINVYTVGI